MDETISGEALTLNVIYKINTETEAPSLQFTNTASF